MVHNLTLGRPSGGDSEGPVPMLLRRPTSRPTQRGAPRWPDDDDALHGSALFPRPLCFWRSHAKQVSASASLL
jgi:hypothetical protein